MGDRAAFANSDGLLETRVGDPNSAFRVKTDAVREVGTKIGPDPVFGKRTVGRDVPGG